MSKVFPDALGRLTGTPRLCNLRNSDWHAPIAVQLTREERLVRNFGI